MKRRTLLGVALAAFVAATPAWADVASAKPVVDAAKDRGLVGEQADGYLGFVRARADTKVKTAVTEINTGRAELYEQVAARYGVDPVVAGALSFEQRFDGIPSGHYWRDPAGTWHVKD